MMVFEQQAQLLTEARNSALLAISILEDVSRHCIGVERDKVDEWIEKLCDVEFETKQQAIAYYRAANRCNQGS